MKKYFKYGLFLLLLFIVDINGSNAKDTKDLQLGDYVKMFSSLDKPSIRFFYDTVIDVRKINLWRVIGKNSDGTVDLVSVYLMPENPVISYSYPSYFDVKYLIDLANLYANEKYTVATRPMGYDGQVIDIDDLNLCNSEVCEEKYAGGDDLYLKDYNLVAGIGALNACVEGQTSNCRYHLASRYYSYAPNERRYGARIINNGTLAYRIFNTIYTPKPELEDVGSGGFVSINMRPIITIKSDLNLVTGNGSVASPYILDNNVITIAENITEAFKDILQFEDAELKEEDDVVTLKFADEELSVKQEENKLTFSYKAEGQEEKVITYDYDVNNTFSWNYKDGEDDGEVAELTIQIVLEAALKANGLTLNTENKKYKAVKPNQIGDYDTDGVEIVYKKNLDEEDNYPISFKVNVDTVNLGFLEDDDSEEITDAEKEEVKDDIIKNPNTGYFIECGLIGFVILLSCVCLYANKNKKFNKI